MPRPEFKQGKPESHRRIGETATDKEQLEADLAWSEKRDLQVNPFGKYVSKRTLELRKELAE